MKKIIDIYVALLNESVDVWRPVKARKIGSNVYQITEAEIPEGEEWEFGPGSVVNCKENTFANGSVALVAYKSASEQVTAPDASSGPR
jgi:hypothetical protein